jgi:hypothetical protein
MPTYSHDESLFANWEEEYERPFDESKWTRGPNGEYIRYYQATSVQIKPEQLTDSLRAVWFTLKEVGVPQIRCLYDGGGDEGFAHFEAAQFNGETLNVNDVASQFSEGPLGERLEPPNAFYPPAYLDHLSRQERVKYRLDELADALASKLLGRSFGTGEGSMYGAFHVDMNSGEIVDEPTAAPQ